jgi:hypothetical protein
MSGMAATAISVKTAILDQLRAKECRPIDLLHSLGNKSYSDSDIKIALSELLSEGQIELTPQRVLRVATNPDAA